MAYVRMTLDDIRASRPEVDRAKLDATTDAAIARQIAEDPDTAPDVTTLGPAISPREVRDRLGLTQEAFAAALRLPVATLRNWEQGRTIPDPAARSLLLVVAREPEAALRALAA